MPKTTTDAGDPTETAIRDDLLKRLDLVEPALTLIGAEVRLPSPSGAHGFLDIFARDASGKLVIIEIKRTRSAAREAIQELFKYVALIRAKHLVQVTDYRVILLAVEWGGLLEAYSEFAPHAPFEVSARRIILGPDGLADRIEPVSPIANAAPRRFAVRHFLWGFTDQATADAAAPKLASRFQALGLVDFVLVRSRPTDPAYNGQVYLYFGQQELSFEVYDTLLQAALDEAAYAEFQETIADLSELEDRVAFAADEIWAANGAPGSAEIGSILMEIANPEKARYWFRDIQQADLHIHRFGRFADALLTDDVIIADLEGEGGGSDYRLRYSARVGQSHEISELNARIENVFFFNADWQAAAYQLVRYAERTKADTVDIVAFSNEDVLRTIASVYFGYPGFFPSFRLKVHRGDDVDTFAGVLEWDGTPFDFDALIAKHFDGDPFSYFLRVTVGEGRQINQDLLATLGLRYAVFRERDDGLERIRVQGSSIVTVDSPIQGSIPALIEQNPAETKKLADMFMEHDQGFGITVAEFIYTQDADQKVEAMIAAAPRTDDLWWTGPIEHCDSCSAPFAGRRYMIDAIGFRGWGGANVCSPCFIAHGRGRLGSGYGQAYIWDGQRWRIVGG